MDLIMEMVPKMFELVKWVVGVDERQPQLRETLEELDSKVEDMNKRVMKEEEKPGSRRKNVINAYFNQVHQYKVSAETVLARSQQEQWMVKRMTWVPSIERHCKEGQELLNKGRLLEKEGLTCEDRTHRMMLPVEEDQYLGAKATDFLESAVGVMKDGSAHCIGIHGYAGAGKTNLMKHLYNKVFLDGENFKAVFWATAPDLHTDRDHVGYKKALQQCVADGIGIDLENNVTHDEVRCASRLLARLSELGPGRVVFFLDDVKGEFPAYELLGMPTPMTSEIPSVDCILVFSTLSKEVCNKMQCDLTLQMGLLGQDEAKNLFLHELKRGDYDQVFLNRVTRRIHQAAIRVANECAGMPLAVIVIARSMASIKNLHEWNNRFNELQGTVKSIHSEEEKILEQLQFGYNSLKDRTVQLCFLKAATLLSGDRHVSKQEIIDKWKRGRLIGTDRPPERANDQGHTVLNQLERMCLVQVGQDHQTVTMNKWICKMATKVTKQSNNPA